MLLLGGSLKLCRKMERGVGHFLDSFPGSYFPPLLPSSSAIKEDWQDRDTLTVNWEWGLSTYKAPYPISLIFIPSRGT